MTDAPDIWITPTNQAAPADQPPAADEWIDPHHQSTGELVKSALWGLARGALEAPGVAGDVANLSALGIGKVMPYVGMPETGAEWQEDARRGLSGANGFDMGSAAIANLLDKMGISYAPQGDQAKKVYNVAHFAGSVPAAGGLGWLGAVGRTALREGGEAAVQQVAKLATKEGAIDAARATGNQLITGVGAGSGSEIGRSLVSEDSPWWVKLPVETAGAVLGGGLGGLSANMNAGLLGDRPAILRDYDAAGVTPRFGSDLGPDQGNWLTDTLIPRRFGARGISADSAQQTQNELSNSTYRLLADEVPPELQKLGVDSQTYNRWFHSPEELGLNLSAAAKDAVERAKAQTHDAYAALDAAIPPGSITVTPTASQQALSEIGTQSSNPGVQSALNNPISNRFRDAISSPTLDWTDLYALRKRVSILSQSSDPEIARDAKHLYDGITADLTSSASGASNPEAIEAFNNATRTARENAEVQKGLTENIIHAETPEMAPRWTLGQAQYGPTRLNRLLENVQPDQQANLGRGLLLMSGMGPDGKFDLDRFMKFVNGKDSDAIRTLSWAPGLEPGLERAQRIYANTEQSRKLISGNTGFDPVEASAAGLSGIAGLGGAVLTGAAANPLTLAAAGTAAAMPPLSALSALLTQRTGTVGFHPDLGGVHRALTPNITPDIYPREQPDTYTPPPEPHAEATPTGPLSRWLTAAPRQQATAWVGQHLGQHVAAQLPQDDTGFKAGLFALYANPQYRNSFGDTG